MLGYTSLPAVAAIVREGTFERAARALNVTPSAISQRVKQLAERLGGVLIARGQPSTATLTGTGAIVKMGLTPLNRNILTALWNRSHERCTTRGGACGNGSCLSRL
jgi:DNA-binding transcriptional LysR family regulator